MMLKKIEIQSISVEYQSEVCLYIFIHGLIIFFQNNNTNSINTVFVIASLSYFNTMNLYYVYLLVFDSFYDYHRSFFNFSETLTVLVVLR